MIFTEEDDHSHHHSDGKGHHSYEDGEDHSESRHSTGHSHHHSNGHGHNEGSRPHNSIVIDIPPGNWARAVSHTTYYHNM